MHRAVAERLEQRPVGRLDADSLALGAAVRARERQHDDCAPDSSSNTAHQLSSLGARPHFSGTEIASDGGVPPILATGRPGGTERPMTNGPAAGASSPATQLGTFAGQERPRFGVAVEHLPSFQCSGLSPHPPAGRVHKKMIEEAFCKQQQQQQRGNSAARPATRRAGSRGHGRFNERLSHPSAFAATDAGAQFPRPRTLLPHHLDTSGVPARTPMSEAATHPCTAPVYRDRYQQTKARIGKQRGAKVAQVDLARRLAEAIWHMLTRNQPFAPAGATDPWPPDGP
jgi:hypothetical protein